MSARASSAADGRGPQRRGVSGRRWAVRAWWALGMPAILVLGVVAPEFVVVVAVVVVLAVAWLIACSSRRRHCGSSTMCAATMASGRALLRGRGAAEDGLVERFGEWRAAYALCRVRDTRDTSTVVTVAAGLPDPGPVFTVHRRARHEAAHAVVAIARDAAIAYANIAVVGEVGGTVRWRGYPRSSRADQLWDMLVVGMAGHVVDVDAGHGNDACASRDLTVVGQAAFELVVNGHRPEGYDGPLELRDVVDAARTEARRITIERAAAIGRVASALAQQKWLRDWQIRELCDPVEDCGVVL